MLAEFKRILAIRRWEKRNRNWQDGRQKRKAFNREFGI